MGPPRSGWIFSGEIGVEGQDLPTEGNAQGVVGAIRTQCGTDVTATAVRASSAVARALPQAESDRRSQGDGDEDAEGLSPEEHDRTSEEGCDTENSHRPKHRTSFGVWNIIFGELDGEIVGVAIPPGLEIAPTLATSDGAGREG